MLTSRPTRWITVCYSLLLTILFIFFEFSFILTPSQAQPQRALEAKSMPALPQQKTAPPPAAKQILVLYTYAGGITVNQKATGAFFSALTSRGVNNDEVFLEYLDLQRNNSPAYRRKVANLLLDKYSKRNIGLIVTVHTGALEFLLGECKALLPEVPVFSFLVASPELIKARNTGRKILLRPQNMDMGGTLEIAMKMFPETRKVVFVVGAAPADRRFEQEARHILEPWRGKVEIEYTSDRTYEEMQRLVATLPRRSIVIYCNVFSDVTGRTFTPLEVGKTVAKAANAPVFCLWDTIMGWDAIGGSLLSFEAEGAYAAKIALDILDKKIVLTKPETTLPSSKTYIFDWRQLKRWRVRESVLPNGSILINREVTFWDFKFYIIGGVAVLILQLLLILGLLVQRRRKKLVEGALNERLRFEQLVSDISAKFLNVAPDAVDREIQSVLKNILEFFHVSRSILIKGSPGEQTAVITHVASADNLPPTPIGANLYVPFPWTSNMMAQGEIICAATLDALPAEASAEKEIYGNLGVRSLLMVPMHIKGEEGYSISISSHREERAWPEECIQRLELLGKILVNILERQRAELLAGQKTEELDQFFDVNLDLLCIANFDGYFLHLNPAWETILGYSREELMANQFLDFIHPDDLPKTREALSAHALQKKVIHFENRYRCKDGSYRWLQWNSTPAGKLIYAAARDITEHKRAEEELKKSEERFRMLVETMNEGLGVRDENGIWSYVNDQLCGMLGELPGDIIGHPVRQFLDEMNQKVFGSEIEKQKKGNYLPYEITWTRSDGRKITTIASPKPIFSGGKLKEVFLVITDITDRKQAEEELRRRNQYIETVLEEAPIGFAIHTIDDGVARFVSTRFEEIYGVPRGTLDSHETFFDKIWPNHPDLREEIRDRVVVDMASGDPQRMHWENIPVPLQSGEIRYITGMNIPVPDQNLMVSTVRDVTEQVRAENALKESELRFREVAENVADFIWEVDSNGLYTYTSPSVEKILGYSPDELVGKKYFYDLFAPDVREELKVVALEVFAVRGSFRALPNPNVSKDGRIVHLETSGGPMLDDYGNLVGYRGADTDVTDRKRAEEELRRHQEQLEEVVNRRTADLIIARDEAQSANRAKSAFLANMSHELRTPLNSILGVAQLMERDIGFPNAYRDVLKVLSGSGAHLLELINDVLELSKVESGKVALDITSFDVHSFLADVEEMMRLRAGEKYLKLLFEYNSPLPQYIETDVRKLRQILINLLGNAIKYTENGGVTLRIAFKHDRETTPEAVSSQGGRIEFEVEDTGIGIAAEDRERIFQPFVQVNPGRTATEGTGLGLTLSQMFVELLGGEMTVRSQPGKGSTFAFHFPVRLAEAAAVHIHGKNRQVIQLMPGHPPYRLLVVDDSAENRLVLRRLLEQVGFDVLEAVSGQEAVEVYSSGQPHLIWMDVRMRGMDGNEAARRIREMESEKKIHTPIIAFTAGVMKDERPSPDVRLFDGWVYKPFRESEIFEMIEKHLGAQFVYQPSVRTESDGGEISDAGELKQSDLLKLSMDWLNGFYRALKKGRSAQLFKLIDQIRQEQGELAEALAGLVRIHRFDKLIAMIEGALQENANG